MLQYNWVHLSTYSYFHIKLLGISWNSKFVTINKDCCMLKCGTRLFTLIMYLSQCWLVVFFFFLFHVFMSIFYQNIYSEKEISNNRLNSNIDCWRFLQFSLTTKGILFFLIMTTICNWNTEIFIYWYLVKTHTCNYINAKWLINLFRIKAKWCLVSYYFFLHMESH